MSWSYALQYALERSRQNGMRYYVRAYRTSIGYWRYGVYNTPRPELTGRVWT